MRLNRGKEDSIIIAKKNIRRGNCSHYKGKLTVLGLGPGDISLLNPKANRALKVSDLIVCYKAYSQFLVPFFSDKEIVTFGMTQEAKRARYSIDQAKKGRKVCLVSSGDPGVYGMAGVVYEFLRKKEQKDLSIEIIPGISAFSSAASLLGAPLMNDFAVISLSDRLTDLKIIEKKVEFAAKGDFVIVLYNPKSKKRVIPLKRAWEILMRHKLSQTPVGIVRNAYRNSESIEISELKNMMCSKNIDMFTTIIVGNSLTYVKGKYMITSRGYDLESESKL